MPVVDISTVRNTVFGVCCIEGEERERVYKQWTSRFSARTAFWVDAKSGDSSLLIVQKLCDEIAAQNIKTMAGTPCILTVFLDLTKELDVEMQSALWQLTGRLGAALQCNVLTVLQFGYVGKLGLDSVAVQRAGLDVAIDCNRKQAAAVQHRICLVGSTPLTVDGGNNWKAVMVLLDAMRRQTSPTNLLPGSIGGTANDDVGFLRYGEFDQNAYDQLLIEQESLRRRLGSGGSNEFSKVLEKKRGQIRELVTGAFAVDGSMQPQHTQMIVESSFLDGKRKKARKGANVEYNQACQATRSAVMLTEARMCDQIEQMMAPYIEKADQILQALLEEAHSGVDFKKDRPTVEGLLIGIKPQGITQSSLELKYDENGCCEEIQTYLLKSRDRTLCQQMDKFNQALLAAYNRQYDAGFDKEAVALQSRLEVVTMRLEETGTAERFCEDIAFVKDPPESVFQPTFAVGNNTKFFLSRGAQMRDVVNTALQGNMMVRAFEIAEVGGGLQVLDDAPLKVVQVVFLDYNETAVDQLLPEV